MTTQHHCVAQVIELFEGWRTARSVTCFWAAHFARGEYEGQVHYAYVQYRDVLVQTQSGWRIRERTLAYMVSTLAKARCF